MKNSSTRSGITNQILYEGTTILQTETGSNAASVNNLMRLWNTSYHYVQYWKKNST